MILNVSSFGGTVVCPMLATYSGSKAFLIYWSKAIAEELRPKGIDVQCLTPSFIVSPLGEIDQRLGDQAKNLRFEVV